MTTQTVCCPYCGTDRPCGVYPDRCEVCYEQQTAPALYSPDSDHEPTPHQAKGRKVRPDGGKERQQTVASRAATLLLSGRAVTARYAIVYAGMVGPSACLYPVRARGEQTPHYRLATRCLPCPGWDGLIID